MNKFLVAGVAAAALTFSGAAAVQAADLGVVVMDDPVMMSDPGFDWDGFYAGLGVSGAAWSNGLTVGMLEGVVGANVTAGHVLFGVEGTFGVGMDSLSAFGWQVAGDGRLGFLATPDVVFYASGGGAYFSLPAQFFGTVGGGVEFAVNDDWSLDAEYEYWFNPTFTAHTVKLSALHHF